MPQDPKLDLAAVLRGQQSDVVGKQLSAGELDELRALTPKGVPETVLPTLVQFYRMNKMNAER